jgi:hypothetical protein
VPEADGREGGLMPKIHGTRKDRAAELRERLERGPSFSDMRDDPFDIKEAERQYKIWASSWILGELDQLVPELKKRFQR